MSSFSQDELLQKIKDLEKSLKDKDELLTKYQEALDLSNKRIQKITKNLEEGLTLIGGIHKNLLPIELPNIPYFEFSYKFIPTSVGVSGDFFDVVKISNSLKFGIIISSCNTYAISALLLSSFLKISHDLNKYKTSKDFLNYVSEQLSSSFSKTDDINLFYGVVDRKDFTLDYCLIGDIFAGVKKESKDHQIFKPSATGFYDRKAFKSEKISLDPQDVFVFCSPGLIKNKNPQGQEFGLSRLCQATFQDGKEGVLGIRQNALFKCNQFEQGIPADRDKTILVMEVKDRILKLTKPKISSS